MIRCIFLINSHPLKYLWLRLLPISNPQRVRSSRTGGTTKLVLAKSCEYHETPVNVGECSSFRVCTPMRRFPPYPLRPHKASGRGRIRIHGRDYYLGLWTDQAACRAEYDRLAAAFSDRAADYGSAGLKMVEEIVFAFLNASETQRPKKEHAHFRRALLVVNRLYGSATAFGVSELAKVRQSLVTGSWLTLDERKARRAVGWCRNQVNAAVTRIRAVWRWAEEQGMVERGAYFHLKALRPLSRADRSVRQSEPRSGVEWENVQAVLPFLLATVASMLELQWWTGMRPSEVCSMVVGMIDGDLCIFDGKNAWRGRTESVILGPEAMRVIRPWLEAARRRGDDAPIFPPSRASAKCYSPDSYSRAVSRTFDSRPELVRFTPYQIRHGAKRRITRSHGLDAARAVLRQSSIQTTDRYDAERDVQTAREAMNQSG